MLWWMETSLTHSNLLLVYCREMLWHHSYSLYSLTTWWQKQLRTLILLWLPILVSQFCWWHCLAGVMFPFCIVSTTRTAAATEQLGLIIIIVLKTKYTTINCNPQPPLQVYRQPIKHVFIFKYLGSMMASCTSDQTRRRALAWVSFWKFGKI